ncbi:MAG TPA: FtsX-like permease family protein [Longimicrobium sp.]|nr:FtsX-like permease family protein [Longimicrobium sp.]
MSTATRDGKSGLEWYISRRYLASRRGTRFLSLITLIAIGGVTVGVMALITVIAVMTGLQNDLRDKILGVNPHIWVMTYGEAMRMDSWPETLAKVRTVDGVVAAAPFVHTELGISNRAGYAEAAVLRGVDLSGRGPTVTAINDSLRRQGLLNRPTRSGLPPLMLGQRLAIRANILQGDTVTLISFQSGKMSPLGMPTPELARFEVVGSFQTGMYEYDNKFMYTTIPAAQKLANLGNSVTGIEVRVPEPMQAMAVGTSIRDRLGVAYRTDDWISMNKALFSALKLEKLAMGIILLLIVIVAAFNIVSTLVMVVIDKTREIGILKSMGMTSGRILRIFIYQGLVIGIVGSLMGAAGGILLTYIIDRYELIKIPGDIYFVNSLPVAYDVVDLATIVLSTILISLFATIYPALQAARLAPVEAIRHE